MQRTTLAAAYLGLALAAGTLRASTADHGALAALSQPPSATPDTPPTNPSLALAQIADDLNLLAQGDWDAEEEAMLAEMMLAETLAE